MTGRRKAKRGPGRPRKERGGKVARASVKDALLAATHELLVERVGGAVSLTEITERAGVNIALVKYYFGDKDGLLRAAAQKVAAELPAEIARLQEPRSPGEKIGAHVEWVIRRFAAYPYLLRAFTEQVTEDAPGATGAQASALVELLVSTYGKLLRDGRRRGEFRAIDPRFFLFTLLGACEMIFAAHAWRRVAFGEGELDERRITALIAHTREWVLRGIAA